jgi:lipoprotein-anchoring transpeptidase ErfK/SrfK
MRKFWMVAVAVSAGAGFVFAVPATAEVKSNITVVSIEKPAKKKLLPQRKAVPQAPRRVVHGRVCENFFQCLFGGSRRGSGGFGFGDRVTRTKVSFGEGHYRPGSIIIRTPERALYYVLPGGEALRYRIGVGRDGFQWGGRSRIVMKREWPEWRPPAVMIERERRQGHIIPEYMAGGPNNPLGARAMYIGGTMFRIHGTNNAASIGGAVSSGCIRMMNADVVDLYDRVAVGSPVYVYQ